MLLPSSVVAATWVPFLVVFLIELVVCALFIRYFASRKRRECGSFVTCTLGLVVALLSSSLLPADIFLVSYAKTDEGQFKDWAATNESRNDITEVMQYTYYGLYGLDVLFVFAILPFLFFYNQSGDEDLELSVNATSSRCVSALKWTVGFIIVAGALLLMGALIPLRETPSSDEDTHISDLKWIIPELGNSHFENSIAVVVNIFTVIGMFFLCLYGALGMSAMPVSWLLGKLSFQSTRDDLLTSEQALRIRIDSARKRGARHEMHRLEGELCDVKRQLSLLAKLEKKCCSGCFTLCRPFQFIFGLIFFILSLSIITLLVFTNLDRIINGEGYKLGYVINGSSWGNPLDWILTHLEVVFPLDYLLILCLLMYIVICTVAGIVRAGVRCMCVHLYRIRPHKTKPEALLFLVYILMFAILAVNVMFYSIAPQYYTYGTQTWRRDDGNGTETVRCAVEVNTEECIKTVSADLLLGYFYKMWVFGVIYYWANWLFVAIFIIGLIYRCTKGRSRATDIHFERGYDSEDSDGLITEEDINPLLPTY